MDAVLLSMEFVRIAEAHSGVRSACPTPPKIHQHYQPPPVDLTHEAQLFSMKSLRVLGFLTHYSLPSFDWVAGEDELYVLSSNKEVIQMTTYTVNLELDADTRKFLEDGEYSLYVFKGIDAGKGAASAVWLKLGGSTVYGQGIVGISWEETYYVGETLTQIQSDAVISGVNPYMNTKNTVPVTLGNSYLYQGTTWNQNPIVAPTESAFWIENQPSQVNSFYVSQKSSLGGTGADDFIVVQRILGNGGTASFTPIEVVAMLWTTQPVKKGAIITRAFSAGAVITMVGTTSADIAYDKDKGWIGPSSQTSIIRSGSPLYESMLGSHQMAKRI